MSEQPLTKEELEMLASYNREVTHGIMHTEIWQRLERLMAFR
jgi:hypothetical protein